MTHSQTVSRSFDNDNTPLPLIVAKHFNFPLAHVETESGFYYAIVDWMLAINNGRGRKKLAHLKQRNPQLQASIKMLPYRLNMNVTLQEPYTDEVNLIYILLSFRVSRWDDRLVKMRNFIAKNRPEYQYLKCLSLDQKLTERKFQSMIVAALKDISSGYETHEHFVTPLGRKIDIVVIRKSNNELMPSPYVLIECKVRRKAFFEAIGQIVCYHAEISQSLFPNSNFIVALAMPNKFIDEYMREMAKLLSIRLLSVANGVVFDAITGEPFSLDILER